MNTEMTEAEKQSQMIGAATTVALIIGFDNVRYFQDFPVGFRLNWRDAMDAGAFDHSETIGDFVKAYCDWLSGRVSP